MGIFFITMVNRTWLGNGLDRCVYVQDEVGTLISSWLISVQKPTKRNVSSDPEIKHKSDVTFTEMTSPIHKPTSTLHRLLYYRAPGLHGQGAGSEPDSAHQT